jgi:hypothetical protein
MSSKELPNRKKRPTGKKISGKNGFSITEKRLFGIIRGLGYNLIDHWVGRFFTFVFDRF